MQTKSFFLGFDISKLTVDYDLINGQDKSLLKGQIANSEAGCKVSPQLTPSFNTSVNLRPLSKIKYTHDKGN